MSKKSITYVERKTSLHGKRVSNHSMIVIKLIAIYVLLERNSTNGRMIIKGDNQDRKVFERKII